MTDTTKYQGQRRQLVKLLEEKGIRDKGVLAAIGSVSRQCFMDRGLEQYSN